jgi:hypothetical protein
MTAVPNPRPERNDAGETERDADVRVGTTVPDDQLREMMGHFGDLDEDGDGGDSRPEEVALNKTRTWG